MNTDDDSPPNTANKVSHFCMDNDQFEVDICSRGVLTEIFIGSWAMMTSDLLREMKRMIRNDVKAHD